MARRGLIAVLAPLTLAAALVATGGGTAQSQVPTQSPVDVTAGSLRFDPARPELKVSYGHSDLELEYIRKDVDAAAGCTTRNTEETEEAFVTPGSAYVTVANVRYDLIQLHFHTPSEHRFQGRSTPLEMHLVHRSAEGELLVIGVPLHAGRASTVDKVLATLVPECGANVEVSDVDLRTLLPSNLTTFRYNGSLTTAPFTEGVQWFLTREMTVSHATITRFQGLFTSGNSRPIQPLDGRTVAVVPQI